jgi:hypothetical protein
MLVVMLNLLAQNTINLQPSSTDQFAGLGTLTVPGIISAAIRLTVVVAAIVFFFILVIGGIRWIASGGDKAQTEAARNQITAALVGLVIVFAAWAIVQLINVFFHVNIFTLAIPSV